MALDFVSLDVSDDVWIRQSLKQTRLLRLTNRHQPPAVPAALEPSASPRAKVSCNWWNGISAFLWADPSVEREDANCSSASHWPRSLFKEWSNVASSCVWLFTRNMGGNIRHTGTTLCRGDFPQTERKGFQPRWLLFQLCVQMFKWADARRNELILRESSLGPGVMWGGMGLVLPQEWSGITR